jgi:hypothetical protein
MGDTLVVVMAAAAFAFVAAAFTGGQALIAHRRALGQANPVVGFRMAEPSGSFHEDTRGEDYRAMVLFRFTLGVLGQSVATNLKPVGTIDFGSGPKPLQVSGYETVWLHQVTVGGETPEISLSVDGEDVEYALHTADLAKVRLQVDYCDVLGKRYRSTLAFTMEIRLIHRPAGIEQLAPVVDLRVLDQEFTSRAIASYESSPHVVKGRAFVARHKVVLAPLVVVALMAGFSAYAAVVGPPGFTPVAELQGRGVPTAATLAEINGSAITGAHFRTGSSGLVQLVGGSTNVACAAQVSGLVVPASVPPSLVAYHVGACKRFSVGDKSRPLGEVLHLEPRSAYYIAAAGVGHEWMLTVGTN